MTVYLPAFCFFAFYRVRTALFSLGLIAVDASIPGHPRWVAVCRASGLPGHSEPSREALEAWAARWAAQREGVMGAIVKANRSGHHRPQRSENLKRCFFMRACASWGAGNAVEDC